MTSPKARRQQSIELLQQSPFDVIVIGAGINGAVSAAALAAAGAKVALVDQGDFAGNTSSNSSNLIWGGIKYLESHEYGLVNKLCQCRNRLMQQRPSSVSEIRFLTTINRGFRFPPWFMYAGTLLYWAIGRFFTRSPQRFSVAGIKKREPVIDTLSANGGFEYSDCHLRDGDARFVFQLVRHCQQAGGLTLNYVKVVDAKFSADTWQLRLRDQVSGAEYAASTAAIVNATGPAVDQLNQATGQMTKTHHAFSKGVHLIVPKLTKDHRILAFFASDGRLFFVTPIGGRSCIGTTDTRVESDQVRVSEEDVKFILSNANELLDLEQPLTENDVISRRCGVRPLAVEGVSDESDWLQMSRKHILELDQSKRHLSIFGGKLTDCLNVGEEVVDHLRSLGFELAPLDGDWCAEPTEASAGFDRLAKDHQLDTFTSQGASEPLSTRLWRRYEDQASQIAESILIDPSLARPLFRGSDFCRAELQHALENEMVVNIDDLLRRRSDIAMTVESKDLEPMLLAQIAAQIGFPEPADD